MMSHTPWHIMQASIILSSHSVCRRWRGYTPAGLADDWADKLAGQGFFSRAQKATFEHYMQVCTAFTSCLTTHVCQTALDWECGAAALGEGHPMGKAQTLPGDAWPSPRCPLASQR